MCLFPFPSPEIDPQLALAHSDPNSINPRKEHVWCTCLSVHVLLIIDDPPKRFLWKKENKNTKLEPIKLLEK